MSSSIPTGSSPRKINSPNKHSSVATLYRFYKYSFQVFCTSSSSTVSLLVLPFILFQLSTLPTYSQKNFLLPLIFCFSFFPNCSFASSNPFLFLFINHPISFTITFFAPNSQNILPCSLFPLCCSLTSFSIIHSLSSFYSASKSGRFHALLATACFNFSNICSLSLIPRILLSYAQKP